MSLNPQQQAVVDAPAPGTIQVSALAGSGKSTVLIERALKLLEGNAKTILIQAFNKRIQLEMAQKVDRLPQEIRRRITVQTSHSFALRMVRDFLPNLGHLIKVPAIEVVAQDWKIIKAAQEVLSKQRVPLDRKELQTVAKALVAIGDLQRAVSAEDLPRLLMRFRTALKVLTEIGLSDPLPLARAIYLDRYTTGQLTFSDMVPLAVELDDACFTHSRYDYLMVDEAQDLNLVQHRLVEKLYKAAEGLTLVGDEQQSIYSFSGAAPHVFTEAPKRYGAQVFPMETNYRSSRAILEFTNTLLRDALCSPLMLKTGRQDLDAYPRPWIKATSTLEWLDYIRQEKGVDLSEIAILYRANKQGLGLELTMISNRIPYQAKSGGFLSLGPVQDLLSYLMMLASPNEDWWLTVVSHWPFLGKDTANSSMGACMFSDIKEPWHQSPPTLRTHSMRQGWGDLREFMDGLKSQRTLQAQVDQVERQVKAYWQDRYADDPEALEDAYEVGSATCEWLRSLSSLEDLLAVVENRKQLTSDRGLTLSTIHRAKGLEWDAVLLHGLGDLTFIKTTGDISDEEFRLAYVAFTRARKYLTLGIDESSQCGGLLCVHLRSVYYPDDMDPLSSSYDHLFDPCLKAKELVA